VGFEDADLFGDCFLGLLTKSLCVCVCVCVCVYVHVCLCTCSDVYDCT
jgi:hypothetical protein